ncbi:hypothetical protein L596_025071 [Steinernema carpocapsae]|uniref:Uncharacterized protein n=1 Tax=Steinernema carpocapsae TaxID=34508 RepID=A0A4U5M6Q0_STECR|nr:hypothetical protein L596_025071 [Steinernema carpocapsae]
MRSKPSRCDHAATFRTWALVLASKSVRRSNAPIRRPRLLDAVSVDAIFMRQIRFQIQAKRVGAMVDEGDLRDEGSHDVFVEEIRCLVYCNLLSALHS